MDLFRARRTRAGRRLSSRLRLESLENRTVPAAAIKAVDEQTIAVGFRTGNPNDPIEPHAVVVRAGQTVDDALAQWRKYDVVAYAEPNLPVHADVVPNDPMNGVLYAQNNTGQNGGTVGADMQAPQAWDLTTGSLKTVVAVIDTGIDYDHPDLYRNIWINQAEIPPAVRTVLSDVDGDGLITFADLNAAVNIGPGKITDLNGDGYIDGGDILKPLAQGGWADGLDEGSNGYRDDLIGWDFVGNDNDPMDVVAEDGGHGTHVAGTIGAMGNNGVGVNGVAWQVELMPVRFLGLGGGDSVAAAAAIRYSANNGARISNNSWGGSGYSQTIFDAISYARSKGQVFVTAAGNDSANNDTTGSYPANDALDNIVSVAATDRNDRLASFSNYGRTSVDLAAAGVEIASTYPGNQYASMSGTSMATPQVSGAFALLLSREPSLAYSDAIARVVNNVDPVPALSTQTVSGGRLNVFKALTAGAVDVTGPSVVRMTPVGRGNGVRVTFSEPVDPATFIAADVIMTNGRPVSILGVAPVGTAGTQFDIRYEAKTSKGTFTVRVGPDVSDLAGNRMDQDHDGLNGEATQDQFVGTFTYGISSGPATYSSNVPVDVPDLTTVTSQITVTQDVAITDLNVLVNLTHTYVSDLTIDLRGPDGTTVRLFDRRGGAGDNLTNTTFDDEASATLAAGAAPFSGSFRPAQVLSAFDGKSTRGVWELRITDNAAADVGQLQNWSLTMASGS
ncbi:MAG TPA: S8 family serine peptidase [Gemmataceae bacterium]|nr:S8 family serine peptidase [Gemmataceae bacterium]